MIDKIYKNLPDILDESICWEWKGCKDKNGYGMINHNGKTLKAHRISYEIYYAVPLGALHCLHKCDNPKCINPLHLFSGTNLDNVKDKIRKGRSFTGNQKGEKNGASKLLDAQVIKIRELYKTGRYTTCDLSKKFNVHRSTISYIVNNKTYKHLLEN